MELECMYEERTNLISCKTANLMYNRKFKKLKRDAHMNINTYKGYLYVLNF